MNRIVIIIFSLLLLAGCKKNNNQAKRIAMAEVGNTILYYDEIPKLDSEGCK